MSAPQLAVTHKISAKLIAGEEAASIVEAIEAAYPDAHIVDNGAYYTVERDGELVFDMDAIGDAMGHPYSVSGFLTVLTSYTGLVDVQDRAVTIRELA